MPRTMSYAGLWPRSLAFLIDTLVLVPFLALQLALAPHSILLALISYIGLGLLSSGYRIYFHARWGQTLGKMLAKIKVTRLDGSTIGLRHALIRSSVDIVFWATWMIGTIYVFVNVL